MTVSARFLTVTDLLLGAVYADERLEGQELQAVRGLLQELIGSDSLPSEVELRIQEFDPEDFELSEVAAEFEPDDSVSKRRLLELVAAVFDADGEVDFAEDDYLRHLAEAMGMDSEDYEDLVIEYEVDDVGSIGIDVVVSIPPPVPGR